MGGMLEGVKVAEFAWLVAGPLVGSMLANYGATVVRVESTRKPDVLRVSAPYRDQIPGINRSAYFALFNANKEGLALNLEKPEGREVARQLIGWADVVTESFTPGTMNEWGLDYESAKVINPSVIYLSTSMQGQTGPHRVFKGFGVHGASLAGFYHLTGYPDRDPAGPYGAYSDFVASIFNQLIVLAALTHKRKTGQGAHIDLSQMEAAIHFLGPALLEYGVNGRMWNRMGNKDVSACPHGVYPCRGDDAWIAIAATSDTEWRALCEAMEREDWLADARFQTLTHRKQHEAALDDLIAAATRPREQYELMHSLQAKGVRSGVVQKASQVAADPQYQARRRFQRLKHQEIGEVLSFRPAFRLSKCPPIMELAAPCIGEHTDKVLKEYLGMSDAAIADLTSKGALE